MTPDALLPGLATDEEMAAGRRVVRCGLCGHPLHDPASRAWGMGEDCRRKLGERTAPAVRRFEVEQEGLFGV